MIKNKYGFEKLYKQGLTIKTPLNINYQIYAIEHFAVWNRNI